MTGHEIIVMLSAFLSGIAIGINISVIIWNIINRE